MNATRENDCQVLADIFFPGQDGVVFLGDNPLKNTESGNLLPDTSGVVAFGKKPVLTGWQHLPFDYVNNPAGGIRWLYPAGLRLPLFLKLYNGSGWRGFVFKNAFRAAFSLGLKKLAKSGTVHIFYKNNPPLEELSGQCRPEECAIFTGTVGENRKAVIALSGQSGDWFYKLPFSAASGELVRNEWKTLMTLQALGLKKMTVPLARKLGKGVLVSDVQPQHAVNSFDLQSVHFEALREFSMLTMQTTRLRELPFWREIDDCLKALREQPILNDLPPATVDPLIEQLHYLRDLMDPDMPVPTSLAHGDFTPWNMFIGKDQLHVYDWELSERLPLLYDAFHFVFQSGVLVKKQRWEEVRQAVFLIKNEPLIREMLNSQTVSFEAFFQLYLLRNISYYLLKYIRQRPLHGQAHWLLEMWKEVLFSFRLLQAEKPLARA